MKLLSFHLTNSPLLLIWTTFKATNNADCSTKVPKAVMHNLAGF
jgi:hypothetical protein